MLSYEHEIDYRDLHEKKTIQVDLPKANIPEPVAQTFTLVSQILLQICLRLETL